MKDKFPELGDLRTDAQCALQFARNTPGVTTAIVGMSKIAHLEENAGIIKYTAAHRGH